MTPTLMHANQVDTGITPIPKTIHFIWIGSQIPLWAQGLVDQCKAIHPGWEVVVHGDEIIATLDAELKEAFDGCEQWCQRADILRYVILHRFGGIYLDIDTLVLRNMEPLLQLGTCWAARHLYLNHSFANGVLGAQAGSSLTAALIAQVRARFQLLKASNQGKPSFRTQYGPALINDVITANDLPGFVAIPDHYFYGIAPREAAHAFWQANQAGRDKIWELQKDIPRLDAEAPFGVSLWGVEGSSTASTAPKKATDYQTFDRYAINAASERGRGKVDLQQGTSPCLFNADLAPIFLGNHYRGRSCFLLCGGPSVKNVDLSPLDGHGIMLAAINNAAATYRPHIWIGLDTPDTFLESVWRDPTIQKFHPLAYTELRITKAPDAPRACDMPNVVFLRRNDAFNAETWLHEDTLNWGDRGDEQRGGRSTMVLAIRLLYHLGFRRIYLLGADFSMKVGPGAYHFDQGADETAARRNNNLYAWMNKIFTDLRPTMEANGLEVLNCENPGSRLTAFAHVSLADAVAQATKELVVDPSAEQTAGRYDAHYAPKKQESSVSPTTNDERQLAVTFTKTATPASIKQAWDDYIVAEKAYFEFDAKRRVLSEAEQAALATDAQRAWAELQTAHDKACLTSGVPRFYKVWTPPIKPDYTLPAMYTTEIPFTGKTVVVDNGWSLAFGTKGKDIDAADTVVRINEIPGPEWAPEVGTKTDIWVIDTTKPGFVTQLQSFVSADTAPRAIVYLCGGKGASFYGALYSAARMGHDALPTTAHIILLDSDMQSFAGDGDRGVLASAGFSAIKLAANSVSDVEALGYDYAYGADRCSRRRINGAQPLRAETHNIEAEAAAFWALVEAKKVTWQVNLSGRPWLTSRPGPPMMPNGMASQWQSRATTYGLPLSKASREMQNWLQFLKAKPDALTGLTPGPILDMEAWDGSFLRWAQEQPWGKDTLSAADSATLPYLPRGTKFYPHHAAEIAVESGSMQTVFMWNLAVQPMFNIRAVLTEALRISRKDVVIGLREHRQVAPGNVPPWTKLLARPGVTVTHLGTVNQVDAFLLRKD